MELRNLVVNSKDVWIDFSGLDGFSVKVANLSRKELTGLRKKCTTTKFNRKTRMAEEILDEDKFLTQFSKAVVKDWKGLTLKHLETLILVDITGKDPKEELPYTLDNAEILVGDSNEFDTWLNEVVFDLDNFRDGTKGDLPKKTGGTVQKSGK